MCNNAGVWRPREPLSQVAPEAFARVMAINVTGVYLGIATFADDLRAQRSGHIVNTSSMNGLLAFGSFAAYSANKRSEEHTSELQSLMRISYAVFCLKKKKETHSKIYKSST